MDDDFDIIEKAKKLGKITDYEKFCETDESTQYKLSEEEIKYYTSLNDERLNKFQTGDIVFVSNYKYKNGNDGQSHCFVIIDKNSAVSIEYFGFLISSQIEKVKYRFNEYLPKDEINHLNKNSIVKCDDLIKILENDIKFKIGEVTKEELKIFKKNYKEYLSN